MNIHNITQGLPRVVYLLRTRYVYSTSIDYYHKTQEK